MTFRHLISRWVQMLRAGKYIYVLSELSSHFTIHTLPPEGHSTLISRHDFRPPHDRDNPDMLGAGIILLPPFSPSQDSLLIVSNRFSTHSSGDALTLYKVSPEGGTVEPLSSPYLWGFGRHLRALEVDPSGRYVCVAGRDEGGVTILERVGEDGMELKEVARLDIPNVVVPLWV